MHDLFRTNISLAGFVVVVLAMGGACNSTSVALSPTVVPGGRLQLGSWAADVRTVYLDRYEVSLSDYRRCMLSGTCSRPVQTREPDDRRFCNYSNARFSRANHPVDCVSIRQAMDYCEWVGGRLPTAAEWAWAATGRGENRIYPWGNEPRPTCDRAATMSDRTWPRNRHISLACSKRGTAPVTSLPGSASRDGILHLYGNVSEFVAVDERVEVLGPAWEDGDTPMTADYFEWALADRGTPWVSIARGWNGIGFRCAYDKLPN